jgi:hypothetical protein
MRDHGIAPSKTGRDGGILPGFEANGIIQTPPDLVVKFQLLDIVAVILRLVFRLRAVYQREIKG